MKLLRANATFLAISFGLCWGSSLVIHLTGGLDGARLGPIPLSLALIATGCMFAPALAVLVANATARGDAREPLRLAPEVSIRWRRYLLAWLGTCTLIVIGAAIDFAVFPSTFTAERGAAYVPQVIAAVLVAPFVNMFFAMGEELGWRGYLQPRLARALGAKPAAVVVGVIWGVWHWPVIWMGGEYGSASPGFPWSGMAAFVLFTIAVSILLAALSPEPVTVWVAALAHGTINAVGPVAVLFSHGGNKLFGPVPNGLVAGVPLFIVAFVLMLRPRPDGASPGSHHG